MSKKISALLLALALLLPATTFAAPDRAILEAPTAWDTDSVAVATHFMTGANETNFANIPVSIVGVYTPEQYMTAITNGITSYATGQSWTLSNGVIFAAPTHTELRSSIASATSSLNAQITSAYTAAIASATSSIVSPQAMVFATTSRSLNSAFQVSSTRASWVNYSVDIATQATLTGGQTGTVYLEYANDSGFTSGVTEVARFVNGNSVSLAIAITINQTNTGQVGGIVPAGKYVRLRTQNNTGTPTFTFRSAQEVLLPSN